MKKIILSAAILLTVASAIAAPENSSKKLLSEVSAAMKQSASVQWVNTENYRKGTFTFNNKAVSAFYTLDENNLIGFSFTISEADLPEGATENIAKKYSGWMISNTVMFLDKNGAISYYAEVVKNTKHIALRITTKGKVGFYSNMPQ